MVDKSLKPQEPAPTAAPFGEAEVPKPEGCYLHFRFVKSQLTSHRRNNKGQTASQHLPTLEVLGAYRAKTPSCNIFRLDEMIPDWNIHFEVLNEILTHRLIEV